MGLLNDKILSDEVQAGENGVADAERELARMLSEIKVAPRAEKRTVGEALHNVLRKLRNARGPIGKLEARLHGKDD